MVYAAAGTEGGVIKDGQALLEWFHKIANENGATFMIGTVFGLATTMIMRHMHHRFIKEDKEHFLENKKLAKEEYKIIVKRSKQDHERISDIHTQLDEYTDKYRNEVDSHIKTKETFMEKCEKCKLEMQAGTA